MGLSQSQTNVFSMKLVLDFTRIYFFYHIIKSKSIFYQQVLFNERCSMVVILAFILPKNINQGLEIFCILGFFLFLINFFSILRLQISLLRFIGYFLGVFK